MAKSDRRVRKTREAIKEAFLDIIATKGFDALTVQDVTDAADINRSTFYAHFQDKFDLLDRSIREVLERLMDDAQADQIITKPNPSRRIRRARRILLMSRFFGIFERITDFMGLCWGRTGIRCSAGV